MKKFHLKLVENIFYPFFSKLFSWAMWKIFQIFPSTEFFFYRYGVLFVYFCLQFFFHATVQVNSLVCDWPAVQDIPGVFLPHALVFPVWALGCTTSLTRMKLRLMKIFNLVEYFLPLFFPKLSDVDMMRSGKQ